MTEFDEIISYRKDGDNFYISKEEALQIERLPGSLYKRIEITFLNNEIETILLIGKTDTLTFKVTG